MRWTFNLSALELSPRSRASDTLRSIEFVHNYAVPADLAWEFVPTSIDAKFKLKEK